jgi:hypothetical protein
MSLGKILHKLGLISQLIFLLKRQMLFDEAGILGAYKPQQSLSWLDSVTVWQSYVVHGGTSGNEDEA